MNKPRIIYIKEFGNLTSDWDNSPYVYQKIGLSPFKGYSRTFKVIDEKLFNYAIIKHEIEFKLLEIMVGEFETANIY